MRITAGLSGHVSVHLSFVGGVPHCPYAVLSEQGTKRATEARYTWPDPHVAHNLVWGAHWRWADKTPCGQPLTTFKVEVRGEHRGQGWGGKEEEKRYARKKTR